MQIGGNFVLSQKTYTHIPALTLPRGITVGIYPTFLSLDFLIFKMELTVSILLDYWEA